MTIGQYRKLVALRNTVMTPDRFTQNGFALDTMVPGTILEGILELLSDHEARNHLPTAA